VEKRRLCACSWQSSKGTKWRRGWKEKRLGLQGVEFIASRRRGQPSHRCYGDVDMLDELPYKQEGCGRRLVWSRWAGLVKRQERGGMARFNLPRRE
jgi:hypothetical protein